MLINDLNQFIKEIASKLGFSKIGIASAEYDPNLEFKLFKWINHNYHATMHWIDNRKYERGNIFNYYPNAKSVISLGLNYFTGNTSNNKIGKISNYAWGEDYHNIIKPRLYQFLNEIKTINSNIDGIVCVDTSPIMEKHWAQKSGLGWIGKHTNLITRDFGSWVFLGEIILNTKLDYDLPFTEDLCGTCTACLDACPTNAFPEPYILDSSKCISYLTIEHRGDIPEEFSNNLNGWIYGCDICQEVCPWNIKFSQRTEEIGFQPKANINNRAISEWKDLTEDEYKNIFKKSAIKRTKYKGLMRNIIHNMK